VPIHELMIRKQRLGEFECQLPFGPIRKRATTVIRPYKGCKFVRVVCKGAPEYTMKYCNKILTNEGEVVDFEDDDKVRVLREEIIG
jgi:magnesium-transporting ATPase (P-type)